MLWFVEFDILQNQDSAAEFLQAAADRAREEFLKTALKQMKKGKSLQEVLEEGVNVGKAERYGWEGGEGDGKDVGPRLPGEKVEFEIGGSSGYKYKPKAAGIAAGIDKNTKWWGAQVRGCILSRDVFCKMFSTREKFS